MLKLFFLLWHCSILNNQPPADTSSYTIIKNVNIVDVINGKIITGKTVIIKDSIISAIENGKNHSYPANATIIDGQNKFLMPGLWDMHFHLAWDEGNDTALFKMLLKYGITGVRDMGGSLAILGKFKKEIRENKMQGPDIFGAGPIIDGNPPVHQDFSMSVDSTTDLNFRLDSLKRNGVDFLKVYSLLKEDEFKKIAAWSKQNKIPFAGHLSEYIEPETAIDLGQKSVEHFNRLEDIWLTNKKRMAILGQLMRKNNTWLCPTMITYYLKVHMVDSSIINNQLEKYIHPELKKEWLGARQSRIKKFSDNAQRIKQQNLFQQEKDLLLFLYQQKVKLLAGSDFAGMPYVYPGISLHQELELMANAGIPIAEVLKSVTINPALYFGIEKKNGSVAIGKYANLILLKENPLLNISNTQTIISVFKKGQQVD